MQEYKVASKARRKMYSWRIDKCDYFVLKHLARFVSDQIARHVNNGMKIADIGCGEQPFRKLIEQAGGIYTGVDIIQNSQKTVDIIAPLTMIPVASGLFDIVLCTEVLEHVSDTLGAFREISRILKPGGIVVLTTPFAYPLHEEPSDYVRLTPYLIRQHARLSGLEVAELQASGNEIEVMATVWDNIWTRWPSWQKNRSAQKALRTLFRIPANLIALAASKIFDRSCPKKNYLNVLSVLRKYR